MKRTAQTFGASLLKSFAFALAFLPFGVLYLISDVLFVVAYYLVRYRKKIVRKNLSNAFPEKTEREIAHLSKEFFRHLCDSFVESIKLLHVSEKEMKKRMRFENPELLERLTAESNCCILALGHVANWEWVTTIGLHLPEHQRLGLVYRQLSSHPFDELYKTLRQRFGAIAIERNQAFRTIIKQKDASHPLIVGFLSDQRPPLEPTQLWLKFMNQDTHVQLGMEKFARKLNIPLAYVHVEKVKRGYYVARISVLSSNPSSELPHSITERYFDCLEETITNQPAYYLWSHNRWRDVRPASENV